MFLSSLRQAGETNRCDYGPWRLARTLTVNKKNMSMDRASAAPRPSGPASVTAAAKLWRREIRGLQKPGWCELTLASQDFCCLLLLLCHASTYLTKTLEKPLSVFIHVSSCTLCLDSPFCVVHKSFTNEDRLGKAVTTKSY